MSSYRRWGSAFWSGHWWIPVVIAGAILAVGQGIWSASKLQAERRAGQTMRASASGAAVDEAMLHEQLVTASLA
jgi:hypothetical protein